MGNAIVQSATIQLKDRGGPPWGSVAGMDDSGGDAAFGWVGSTDHLGDITITTDTTYDFGTRAEDSQQWWQVGDRAWDKNGEVILLEASRSDGDVMNAGVNADAFNTMTNVTARRGAKAGLRSDFAYESNEEGKDVGQFASMANSTATVNRLASWGFTGRWTENLKIIRTAPYSANSGTFADGDNTNFILGETFSGFKSDTVTAITGNIIKHDAVNSVIVFTIAGSYNSSDNNGATITGDVSGATATLANSGAANYSGPSSMKLTRSSTDPAVTPTSPETALALTHVATGQHIVEMRNSVIGSDDERPSDHYISGSDWESWEWDADWTATNSYKIRSIKAGDVFEYTHTNPNVIDLSNVAYEFIQNLFAFDWAGGTNTLGHIYAVMKDPWSDTEVAKVILGNNAVFANCTKTSVFRSNSWSPTAVNTKINWSEFTQGEEGFLFIKTNAGLIVNATAGRSMGVAP